MTAPGLDDRTAATVPVAAVPLDDWLLTAPWWHWPRQAPTPPELTVPALQKFATTDFAAEFVADPQRRLVFDDVADRIAPPPQDPVSFTATAPSDETLTKLYLPTHHRSYLVVVELHCDRPGLPNPSRAAVCEAGFVVRRRRTPVPPDQARTARDLQRQLMRTHAQVVVLERRLVQAARRGRVGLSRATALTEQRSRALDRLAAARAAVADWAAAGGRQTELEGWVPLGERPGPELRPLPGLGRWQRVDETSESLDEAVFPMYPLIPDPREAGHDAAGRTIWFGVVPTMSTDLEQLAADQVAAGQLDRRPRLDDLSVYEIRCVVRRHDPRCARRDGQRDCRGPLTWSAPTPGFRLAAPMDGRGTAHRPVTVRMPTRDELAAAAAIGPGYGGVRVQGADYAMDPGGGDFQICSFAIPLITIVATFVLRLFLPIVVFLFGLWVLLALKFCIPPSLSVSAGLDGALDAQAPGADFEAKFGVEVNAALGTAGGAIAGQITSAGLDPPDLSGGLQGRPIGEKFATLKAMRTRTLRTPLDDLDYEPRVARTEVLGS